MLHSEEAIASALAALARQHPLFARLATETGPLPVRRSEQGFAGLAGLVIAQQVSKAAADTIFARLQQKVSPLTGANLMAMPDDDLRAAGLSRPKIRTLRAIAQAEDEGLILSDLIALPAEEAIGRLTPISGIGRWTAECWLLFAGGHPDIFPARDLALQAAAHRALDLPERPGEKALRAIADQWTPNRSAAARLLWAWYGLGKGGAGEPV